MEKKVQATTMELYRVKGLGFGCIGLYRDNGKQNGSYYSMLGITEKKMEAYCTSRNIW